MSAPDEREAFEAWNRQHNPTPLDEHLPKRRVDERYSALVSDRCWQAWQARARYAAPVAGTELLRTLVAYSGGMTKLRDQLPEIADEIDCALGVIPPATDAGAEGKWEAVKARELAVRATLEVAAHAAGRAEAAKVVRDAIAECQGPNTLILQIALQAIAEKIESLADAPTAKERT